MNSKKNNYTFGFRSVRNISIRSEGLNWYLSKIVGFGNNHLITEEIYILKLLTL